MAAGRCPASTSSTTLTGPGAGRDQQGAHRRPTAAWRVPRFLRQERARRRRRRRTGHGGLGDPAAEPAPSRRGIPLQEPDGVDLRSRPDLESPEMCADRWAGRVARTRQAGREERGTAHRHRVLVLRGTDRLRDARVCAQEDGHHPRGGQCALEDGPIGQRYPLGGDVRPRAGSPDDARADRGRRARHFTREDSGPARGHRGHALRLGHLRQPLHGHRGRGNQAGLCPAGGQDQGRRRSPARGGFGRPRDRGRQGLRGRFSRAARHGREGRPSGPPGGPPAARGRGGRRWTPRPASTRRGPSPTPPTASWWR